MSRPACAIVAAGWLRRSPMPRRSGTTTVWSAREVGRERCPHSPVSPNPCSTRRPPLASDADVKRRTIRSGYSAFGTRLETDELCCYGNAGDWAERA